MSASTTVESPPRRYGRETQEFSRVANLSDAVFAIAMTLLVLTLDAPDVPAERLAGALADRAPQLIAFVLSFGLVANIWYQHHKLLARLGSMEIGLITLNMAFLGGVALVPFPTSLLGANPTARAAVVSFVGLFALLLALYLLLFVRAGAVGAWREAFPDGVYGWVLAQWILSAAVLLVALALSLWVPVAGLIVAAASGTAVGVLLSVLAPPAYRAWA